MHDIAKLMAERISAGLKRKSLTTCSRWSVACRIMGRPYPGQWSFCHHPWLRDMHDSEAELNVGQKSAQMGYTETALNRTFFMIDVKGVDCLYVLPSTTPDASDFSAARFDPALEASPHLAKLFSDVKNVGHKRAGNVNLYVRGSKSRSGLKSIPVGMIVLDEVDEMDQDNISLAMERTAGQVEKQVWAISTPTIPKHGINKMYLESTQEHFFFTCPCCSRWTELTFPDCLEITAEDVNDESVINSFLKCKECNSRLTHETKTDWLNDGSWQPTYPNRIARGFHINQLYSSTVSPVSLAKSYLRSLRDPSEEQEFYNSKLGKEHVVEGAGINDSDIDNCVRDYRRADSADRGIITIGIDQGKWIHYWIDQWNVPGYLKSTDLNAESTPKMISHGKIRDFEELDGIMHRFGVSSGVIDALPERRAAFNFACRFNGLIKLCFYGNNVSGKQIHTGAEDEHTITVDRTSWLDLSLGRFRNKTISVPFDINQECKNHLKALVRIYEKDKNGNPVGRYVHTADDHYAHARNYSEIALIFALSYANPSDITE